MLKSRPDKAPVVVQIHYDKYTGSFTEAAPIIRWTTTRPSSGNLGQSGSWFWDHCWGSPSFGYFEWVDEVWDGSGVGVWYSGYNPGPGVCGVKVNSNSGSYRLRLLGQTSSAMCLPRAT